jgi:hypothetical protein
MNFDGGEHMITGQTRTKGKRKRKGGTVLLLTGVVLGLAAAYTDALAQAPAAASASVPPLYSPDHDPYFAHPYTDIDEWRETPVRHRYVHGGFQGTETRFSFYFPPKEQYQGRFFQHITPVPDNENLAQKEPLNEDNKIAAALEGGAYFVETNGGGKFDLGKVATMKYDPTISAYRANAASAAYSRVVAQWVYNTTQRPFGYAYGGSGGAFRTIGSFENTTGVWDGVVPYVMGSNMAIPNMFTWRMRTIRVLGPKLDQVVDGRCPRGQRRPLRRVHPARGRSVTRGDPHGLPPAVLVWLADDGHPRLRRALPGRRRCRPELLHRLLD